MSPRKDCSLGRFFFFFLGLQVQHMKVPRLGLSCRSMPQPQQRQIRVASVTYTTAQGNMGSLTHRAGPGIKPVFSWILVGFITAEPQRELLSWQL